MIARKQLNLLTFVADVAALAALSVVDLDDGVAVYVETLRSYFTLKTGVVAAPDNITSVSALGGLKGWFRSDDVSYSWDSITTFYIDAILGDDENDGEAPHIGPTPYSGPIKTLAELTRRTFRPMSPRSAPYILYVVTGAGDGGSTSQLSTNVAVQIRGTKTTAAPGFVAVDAAVARVVNPYTSQKTTAAIAWDTGSLVCTSADGGVTIDQRGWKQHDIAVDQAVTNFPNTPNPATDTIVQYNLPEIVGAIELFGTASLSMLECSFDGSVTGGDIIGFSRCHFVDVSVLRCPSISLENCYVETAAFNQCDDVNVQGGVFKGVATATYSTIRIEGAAVDSDDLDGDAGFLAGVFGRIVMLQGSGNLEAFQAHAPIRVSESTGSADIRVNGATWYFGAQVTYGLLIDVTNAAITYADKNNLVVAATTAEWAHANGAGGLTTGAFVANLPSTAQLATHLVGIFTRA